MDLSSLNVDVLLYLMKFVHPDDRFNLVLSGILKGFENVNEGIDLHERIENCGAELGLRRSGTCELEIRSLRISTDGNPLKILERLGEKGYLQNTQQFEGIDKALLMTSSFFKVICSMKNLEKLKLRTDVAFEDLALVFQSCSKLTELNITTDEFEMDEIFDLVDQLRPGFQRLRRLNIEYFIGKDSLPGIQYMLTWLKECEQLTIYGYDDGNITSLEIDGSLTLDPNFAKSLQICDLRGLPTALVKWILSVCFNIHALQGQFPKNPNGFLNEIARLKNLKKLNVYASCSSDLIEILRSCRQLEILRVDISHLILRDLAALESNKYITDFNLCWKSGPSIEDILQILKRWPQLRRLTLENNQNISDRSVELLSDFIMAMKNLSYLDIFAVHVRSNYGRLEIVRDKVNELILPLRPNFKFDLSLKYV